MKARFFRGALFLLECTLLALSFQTFADVATGPLHYFTYWVRAADLYLVTLRMWHPDLSRPGMETANAILNVPLLISVARSRCTELCIGAYAEDIAVHIIAPIAVWIDYFGLQTSMPRGGLTALMLVTLAIDLYCVYILVAVGTFGLPFPYGWIETQMAIFSSAFLLPGLALFVLIERPLRLQPWQTIVRW